MPWPKNKPSNLNFLLIWIFGFFALLSFDLFVEARSLYSRGILEFNDKVDLTLLTETNLGHFGIFEGKKVPLDFPIKLTEGYDAYDEIANAEFGMDYDQLGPNEQEWVQDEYDNQPSGRDSINENEYYVTRNKGRGQGKGLVKSVESDQKSQLLRLVHPLTRPSLAPIV